MSALHTEREAVQRAYDEDDDQEDSPMPHRYADAQSAGSDREISLGTGTILAIFFALTLVCSVFFGFGYTIGHKSTGPSTGTLSAVGTHSLSDAFKSFKPAPGGAAATTSIAPAAAAPEDLGPTTSAAKVIVPSTAATADLNKPVAPLAPTAQKPFDPDAEIVTSATPTPNGKFTATPHTATTVRTAPVDTMPVNTASISAATATTIVQVAAVSHQEDADTLTAALRRKGYSVAVRNEPQDKLLHIQLGPYPTRRDAEAMRLRLQADNYNAILK